MSGMQIYAKSTYFTLFCVRRRHEIIVCARVYHIFRHKTHTNTKRRLRTLNSICWWNIPPVRFVTKVTNFLQTLLAFLCVCVF